jgi:glycosyltransferase involved in cell wall biosynthesis
MAVQASVIIVTKNEAQRLPACLSALKDFEDVWVVDSTSRDGTADIAAAQGAKVITYSWNGQYPKKRQWCLNSLPLRYDWVLFVDADEIIPQKLIAEIETVLDKNPDEAGFFIIGLYRLGQKILRHGFYNAKIALLHRARMEFPVVDDVDIPGMGEIEGHYQPVLKTGCKGLKIGTLQSVLFHDALEDERAWIFRHEKYARWEAGMNKRNVWPVDPIGWRQKAKMFMRHHAFRAELMFIVGYIFKLGFLDGSAGLYIARMRYWYHKKIKELS